MVGQESQNRGLQTLFSHSKADDVYDVKTAYAMELCHTIVWHVIK